MKGSLSACVNPANQPSPALFNGPLRFELMQPQAQSIVEEVAMTVKRWKEVATSTEVGLQPNELRDFKPAFR